MSHKNNFPQVVQLSSEESSLLRHQFNNLDEVTPFSKNIYFSSKIASYGIHREIGSVNDELARFIFNSTTNTPVDPESLKSEFVEWNKFFGLRIFSTETDQLELRANGFYDVTHPDLSSNINGTLHSLYFFPAIVNKIAEAHGVELVLVKSWGLNSIFGGFDPQKGYYQTNFWELENNDSLKFADLVRQGKLAFMGTHDLIAHIAGINGAHWPLLKKISQRSFEFISNYFKSTAQPSIASLVLPYMIGVILDDLAQPPSYSSQNHLAVLDALLTKLNNNAIPANLNTILTEFPSSFQNIINLSRTPNIAYDPEKIQQNINYFIQDILGQSKMKRTP